jgi:hypothetical protein
VMGGQVVVACVVSGNGRRRHDLELPDQGQRMKSDVQIEIQEPGLESIFIAITSEGSCCHSSYGASNEARLHRASY